jgi:hypothetical protein
MGRSNPEEDVCRQTPTVLPGRATTTTVAVAAVQHDVIMSDMIDGCMNGSMDR